MVATPAPKKSAGKGAQAKKGPKVQKDIKKKDTTKKDKTGIVDDDFEVDEMERYTGECVFFDRSKGFGFIKLDTEGLAPDDKVMVHWRELQSDDRWPQLHKGLKVELNLTKKSEGRGKFSVKAKEVSLAGGEKIALQDAVDEKKEFVGDKNMRFLGNVKFYDFMKGFGYVTLQEGYAIDADVPNELRVDRYEINAGDDAPRLENNMEIEFGIQKNAKNKYSCYNVTLPGGDNITRDLVEGRETGGNKAYTGTVTMWSWKAGFGWIEPENIKSFPAKIQTAIKEDGEKRAAKAEKNGKKLESEISLYFRTGDKADKTEKFNKGDKVTFKVYTDKQGVGAAEVSKA